MFRSTTAKHTGLQIAKQIGLHFRSTSMHILFVVMVTAVAVAAQPSRPDAQNPLDRMNESMDALVAKVWPSVVQILVTSYGPREDGDRGNASVVLGRQRSVASGFVIDGDGYIMTNAHVVNGAQRIQVVVPPADANGSLASALSGKTKILP